VNKQELVASIAEKAGMTKADASRALDATVAAVTEALRQNETVTLVGFGSFYVGERAARTGRNPRTGKDIEIDAAKVPKFRAGKGLKNSVT
jgi:DNA-binding protein HU-beta